MTLDTCNMAAARRVYCVEPTLCCGNFGGLAAARTWLLGIVTDSELALPLLAKDLLPEALVGVVLAGVFAATMSTVVHKSCLFGSRIPGSYRLERPLPLE